MPLISVIVTCYNVEDYLEECLESVVNQTLQDMEIIIVDDGSSDGTRDIIHRYESSDPRVRSILFSENTIGGVASAANAGLDTATGEYVGFVDGDDYLELDMFEKLCDAAIKTQSDLAMCKYLEFFDETGKSREPAERRAWADFGEARKIQLDSRERVIETLGFIAVPWRKIYLRTFLEQNEIRFPVVDYAWEDNPFHWFSVCSARSVALVPDVLCHHRLGRAGQTMTARNPEFVKIFGHHETIRDWLLKRGSLAHYEGALLGWALAQYEWVAGRLPRGSGESLYDALRPVVLSVDAAILDSALRTKLKSTGTMMRLVWNGDRRSFLERFERRFHAETSASRDIGAKAERAVAMLGLARENLRVYGLRNTISKILTRFGIKGRFSSSKRPGIDKALTEEQMVKLLATLERGNDRKHSELLDRLRDIERALKERGDTE